MTTRLELEEVLKTVIDQVMLRLQAEGVSTLLLDNPAELIFAAVNGASADKLRGTRIPASAGMAGEVMRTGQALRIRTAEDRQRIYRDIESVSQYHALDIVAVPLKLGSEILGVMEAVHSQAHVVYRRRSAAAGIGGQIGRPSPSAMRGSTSACSGACARAK